MKLSLTISDSPLAAADVPALLNLCHDTAVATAARSAASELRALFNGLDADDLLRRALNTPDPCEWLTNLATASSQMRASLEIERRSAKQVVATDAVQRHRLDGAACSMLHRAQEAADTQMRIAMNAKRGLDALRNDLAKTGLSEREIQRVIDARVAAGEVHPHEHTAAVAAAADAASRRDALALYLRDPLRDAAALPVLLLAELQSVV